jgi:putative nucleotidyltransferase with HDIG domain
VHDTKGLTETLTRLPAQPLAALRVLELVDEQNASPGDLARLIETDPALSARVIRLANAPYYGVTRKVSSASRAVMLLGFSTVRALAVSAACSLIAEKGPAGPPGYWAHSVTSAAAASVVARELQSPPGDAFSAGLLHDIGTALLYRRDPEGYGRVAETVAAGAATLTEAERATFGTTHAEAGAAVLEEWRFPPAFVEAVAVHHHPEAVQAAGQLARIVVAGESVAAQLHPPAVEPVAKVDAALAAAGLKGVSSARVITEVRREVTAVAAFLGLEAGASR